MLWLRKLLAVLAISGGASLLLLPFPDSLTGEGEQAAVWLEVDRLADHAGPDVESARRLTAADLAPFPALAAAVERAMAGEIPTALRSAVEPVALRRFHRAVLDDEGIRPTFVVGDALFRGSVVNEPLAWSRATPWLPTAARLAGAALLIAGLALLAQGYRVAAARTGIPIAPMGFAVFCDLVLVAGGLFAVGVAIDAAWVSLAEQSTLLGLAPAWPSEQPFTAIHFVSLPALFVALPLLTFLFTGLSSQRVRIDGDGVSVIGATRATSIRWEELEAVAVREQENPAGAVVADHRSLQTVLDLVGGGRQIRINEPTSRRRKQAIIAALREHVPAAKAILIDTIEAW